jgi:hypothetical protein
MTTISSFVSRLRKVGINVELLGNYPWVYLDKVNGKKVSGTFMADHGFTVFFRGIRVGETDRITDVGVIFQKIRDTLQS